MGEVKFIGSMLTLAVFSIAVIMFAVGFGNDNNTSFNLAGQAGYNDTLAGIDSNLSTYKTQTINASDSFFQSQLDIDNVKTGGQFKLGPATALKSVDNVLNQGFTSIFGSNSSFGLVLTALITFFSLVAFLYIWKTWKGGNPD